MPHSSRFGSSLAALEALAYDDAPSSSAASSCGRQSSTKTAAIDDRSNRSREHPNSATRVPWGWESRLNEAEADLRKLRRRSSSKSSVSNVNAPGSSIADPATVPLQIDDQIARKQTVAEDASSHSSGASRDESMQRRSDRSPSRPIEQRSDANQRPGFGDRWASSVLFEELQSLKKELQKSQEREAVLKRRLEEAERDKDNICRLWDEDRAKMLGMKRTVECAFLSAQTELRNRLASRNANVHN